MPRNGGSSHTFIDAASIQIEILIDAASIRDAQIVGGMGEHVVPHTIFDDPPEPDDVIIVTKHLLSSQSFAQEPFVFCPGARFRDLAKGGPQTVSGRAVQCSTTTRVYENSRCGQESAVELASSRPMAERHCSSKPEEVGKTEG